VDGLNLAYVITQAKLIGNPGDPIITKMLPGVLKRLQLDESRLDDLLRKLSDVYAALEWIFKFVPGGSSHSPDVPVDGGG